MRMTSSLGPVLALLVSVSVADGQSMQQREQQFLESPPRVGERLPDVTVYHPDGTPFSTSELRGHYTVITFGCLT